MSVLPPLASQIAHELNNPLDGVIRYVSLAQKKLKNGDSEGVEAYLSDALFGLQRMADVLHEILDMRPPPASAARPPAPPKNDLETVIRQAIGALAPQAERRSARILYRPEAPGKLAVPAALFQVVCNVIKNALEALPEVDGLSGGGEGNGRGKGDCGRGEVVVGSRFEAGTCATPPMVVIAIADNGVGIPEGELGHVFEPFFTTKKLGHGTGLGLAVSKEIVERLNGSIVLRNRPGAEGGGCECTVRIPLAPPASPRRCDVSLQDVP